MIMKTGSNTFSYILSPEYVAPICMCKNNQRIWRHNANVTKCDQKMLFKVTHALFFIFLALCWNEMGVIIHEYQRMKYYVVIVTNLHIRI